MGNPKQKWTAEEEEALRAGVAKHGAGRWKNIQRDPEFNPHLFNRSNIDLKDKWRNLSIVNGLCSRDKSKAPNAKGNLIDTPATPMSVALVPYTSITPTSQDAPPTDIVMMDSSRSLPEPNNSAMYVPFIYEALSTLNGPDGLETAAIAHFIQQRLAVPPTFRRLLSTKLRRLVQQNKIEKVQNRYKIKVDAQVEMKSLITTVQKDPQRSSPITIVQKDPQRSSPITTVQKDPQRSSPVTTVQKDPQKSKAIVQSIGSFGGTVEEAAACAAYKIAEAENKSFVAAESVKEAERVSMLAEEMESFLQFAMYCYDQSAEGDLLMLG